MNFPTGTPVKTAIDAQAVDFVALLKELKGKLFNGYVCLTIQGRGGIEEGVIVYDNGKIVGCSYEYLAHQREFLGDAAFSRTMNASLASNGIIDVFQLRNDQVQLILAFNEKIICLPSDAELDKFNSTQFNSAFEDEARRATTQADRPSLLKKYGVGAIEKGAVVGKIKSSDEEDLLKDLLAMKRKQDEKK